MRLPLRFRARKSSMACNATIAGRRAPSKVRAIILQPFRGSFSAGLAERDSDGFRRADGGRTLANANAGAGVAGLALLQCAHRDKVNRDQLAGNDYVHALAVAQDPFRFFLTR